MHDRGDPYRSEAETCGFCGVYIEGAQGALCDALPLCRTCNAAQLDRALAKWGFELSENRHSRVRSQMAYAMEIRRPSELDLVAKIWKETFNRKILKAFGRKELQVGGDPDQLADEPVAVVADPGPGMEEGVGVDGHPHRTASRRTRSSRVMWASLP